MNCSLDVLSGLIAGLSQVILGQPLDFIKTRYQISNPPNNISTLSMAKCIVKDHGLLGLYRGSSCLLLGVPGAVAIEFWIYEATKRYVMGTHEHIFGKVPEEVLLIKEIMVCGAAVGFVSAFIYCPVEYAKIQRQASTTCSRGSFTFLIHEIATKGPKNVYHGISVTLAR
jgi:hypothetical protein